MTESKILLIDVETSPLICYTWGIYEVDAVKVIKPFTLLSFAYQWLGEKNVYVHGNIDFGDHLDDKPLCEKLFNLLSLANIVIGQNGDAFDVKKINTRLWVHKIPPPSPYRTIDTLKVLRSCFAMDSNKLDYVGRQLNEGKKIEHRGFEMWEGCLKGNKKDWADMKHYNKGDIDLLRKVYLRERPWIKNHPNLNVFSDRPSCPKCQSTEIIYRGVVYTNSKSYRRFRCDSCGGWGRDDKGVKVSSLVSA